MSCYFGWTPAARSDVRHPEGTTFAKPADKFGCWNVSDIRNRVKLSAPTQCRQRARNGCLTCIGHRRNEEAAQAFKRGLEEA